MLLAGLFSAIWAVAPEVIAGAVLAAPNDKASEARIKEFYRLVYQREPAPQQIKNALRFITSAAATGSFGRTAASRAVHCRPAGTGALYTTAGRSLR